MKHQSAIRAYAILLLLLYSFSNSPYIKFHTHHFTPAHHFDYLSNRGNTDNAPCFTLQQDEKRCALCDNHSVSLHDNFQFGFENAVTFSSDHGISLVNRNCRIITLHSAGRGPPCAVFASV